jgi:hypothetical protein
LPLFGLKAAARSAEPSLVYTPTKLSNPPPRAKALFCDVVAMIKERRAQDPSLGVPDTLIALELVKSSLLEESGITLARGRFALVAAVALSAMVAGFALFLMSQ